MKKQVPVVKFSCPVAFSQGEGDREFSGVAYGGGLITDHWAGPVGFDLASMTVKPPIPALLEHSTDKPIGVINQASASEALTVAGRVFSGFDESAKAVTMKADAGMPWGLSVYIVPGRVLEVQPGETYALNGQAMTGPFNVYLDSYIREVSFCAVAADRDAKAQIFTGDNQSELVTVEVSTMTDTTATHDQELADLKAKFAAAETRAEQAEAKARDAEANVAKITEALGEALGQLAEIRKADVKATFAAIGKEFTDQSAAPYLSMTGDQFAAWKGDIESIRQKVDQLPAGLFTLTQPGGEKDELKTLAEIQANLTKKFGGAN